MNERFFEQDLAQSDGQSRAERAERHERNWLRSVLIVSYIVVILLISGLARGQVVGPQNQSLDQSLVGHVTELAAAGD